MDDPIHSPLSDDEIDAWIRRHPEVWHHAGRPVPVEGIDDDDIDAVIRRLVDGITSTKRRRPRRRVAVAVGAVLAVAAVGGTTAALMSRDGQPSRPEGGVTCLAEPSLRNHAVAIGTGMDPIEGCRAEWEHGSFRDLVDGTTPALVACISPAGAINVFPGDAAVCDELELQPADANLDAESAAVVALQDRLADEINAAGCVPAADVAEHAQRILDEARLPSWQIRLNPDATASACALVAVDSESRLVRIIATKGDSS